MDLVTHKQWDWEFWWYRLVLHHSWHFSWLVPPQFTEQVNAWLYSGWQLVFPRNVVTSMLYILIFFWFTCRSIDLWKCLFLQHGSQQVKRHLGGWQYDFLGLPHWHSLPVFGSPCSSYWYVIQEISMYARRSRVFCSGTFQLFVVSGVSRYQRMVWLCARIYFKLLLRASQVSYTVIGLENLDQSKHYIFACNHEVSHIFACNHEVSHWIRFLSWVYTFHFVSSSEMNDFVWGCTVSLWHSFSLFWPSLLADSNK